MSKFARSITSSCIWGLPKSTSEAFADRATSENTMDSGGFAIWYGWRRPPVVTVQRSSKIRPAMKISHESWDATGDGETTVPFFWCWNQRRFERVHVVEYCVEFNDDKHIHARWFHVSSLQRLNIDLVLQVVVSIPYSGLIALSARICVWYLLMKTV